MQMRTRSALGIVVGIGAATAVVAVLATPVSAATRPAAPATTAGTTQKLDLDDKAKISARGAAIRIPYSFVCTAGWEGNLNVQVVEALGENLASGYANKNLTCNGAKKTASLYVQVGAYQGARPFKAGPASVVATLDTFDPKADPCSSGGPCPMAAEPKAAPQPPGMFTTASVPTRPTGTSADTFAHSEVQGTITLVD
jgi:hypothetical protein